jgi:hypothetical protein
MAAHVHALPVDKGLHETCARMATARPVFATDASATCDPACDQNGRTCCSIGLIRSLPVVDLLSRGPPVLFRSIRLARRAERDHERTFDNYVGIVDDQVSCARSTAASILLGRTAGMRATGPARQDTTTALRIARKRALDLNCRVAYGN